MVLSRELPWILLTDGNTSEHIGSCGVPRERGIWSSITRDPRGSPGVPWEVPRNAVGCRGGIPWQSMVNARKPAGSHGRSRGILPKNTIMYLVYRENTLFDAKKQLPTSYDSTHSYNT